jgi:hypothetical protein
MEDPATLEKLLRDPPKGFTVLEQNRFETVIRHRSAGMGCMTTFLLVWITGWTIGCVLAMQRYFVPVSNRDEIPLFVLVLLLTSEVGVGAFIAFVLFSRRSFRFEGSLLTTEIELLGLRRLRTYQKDDIASVRQIKDGGEGDDSFPSWGLRLETREGKKTNLLFRQPYESSAWLGDVFEAWTGSPVARASPK